MRLPQDREATRHREGRLATAAWCGPTSTAGVRSRARALAYAVTLLMLGAKGETANGGGRIAYILRSYPRLSQTFILDEILALERLGLAIDLFALTRADDPFVHER